MKYTKNKLEDYIKKGLAKDIFLAEQSYYILKYIQANISQINITKLKEPGLLFNPLQGICKRDLVVSLGRLYDTPKKNYDVRSLKSLIDYLHKNHEDLPAIVERENLLVVLNRLKIIHSTSIDNLSDNMLTHIIISHFLTELSSEEISDTLDKLKQLRDKQVSHNEVVDEVSIPTLESLNTLISLAKDLVGIIGWAYLGIIYHTHETYLLTGDAKRASFKLKSLIELIS